MPTTARRPAGRLFMLCLIVLTGLLAACSDDGAAAPEVTQPTNTTEQETPVEAATTVVLVHGAFATAASWDRVTPLLEDAGYNVVVPELPLRSLAGDAEVLGDALASIEAPTIVVGHSYGGIVLSEVAAADPEVEALVYVAGFAPDEGESISALQAAFPGSQVGPDTLVFTPYTRDDGTSGTEVSIRADRFAEVFAADLPADAATAAADAQRPLDLDVLGTPSGPPAWTDLPSWALIATADNVIPVAGGRAMAARSGAEVTEIDASHAVLVSHPEAVLDQVNAAAASLA